MCLIALAWKANPRYRLAVIANRDEFHARPTLAAAEHADAPGVFGGRDLDKGGSWLLASATGRFAAVTNVRMGSSAESAARSRGALTAGFMTSGASLGATLEALRAQAAQFGRFNLLLSDGEQLQFASNHPDFRQQAVAPGLHAMSNGDLDDPWPKAGRAQAELARWLEDCAAPGSPPDVTALFAALADTTPAPDALLPDTGVGRELERRLSPAFIVGDEYGTRASTVLLLGDGEFLFAERSFGPGGRLLGQVVIQR